MGRPGIGKTMRSHATDGLPIYARSHPPVRVLTPVLPARSRCGRAPEHRFASLLNEAPAETDCDQPRKEYDLRADKRKSLTAKAVKRELTGEKSSDFFGYAQEYAENLNVKGEYWEWKKVRVMINRLRDFTSGETCI